MNIRQLKKKIQDLPEDMEVVLSEHNTPGDRLPRINNIYVTKARRADEDDTNTKDVVVIEMRDLRQIPFILNCY